MPDYGHPLRFATFIGPTNSPPSRPVELAQLSERLGFDFVTFQDHPYQSSYLDTWTLLSLDPPKKLVAGAGRNTRIPF